VLLRQRKSRSMEVLDVQLAKGFMLEMVDRTNELVQAVHRGGAQSYLFVAVIRHLVDFCKTFRFCVVVAVQAKQGINEMKYPLKLNHGIIMDYKLVSSETGIDKNSASDAMCSLSGLHSTEEITGKWLDKFLVRSKAFVERRNWCKYEQPRMLCFAMVEEVGELCGVLKFIDDNDEEVSCRVYGEMVSEICDIFIYFCRLSDLCGFFEDIKKEVEPG
jgi:hypothetical protein